MKVLKIVLLVTAAIFLLGLAIAGYAWYQLTSLPAESRNEVVEENTEPKAEEEELVAEKDSEVPPSETATPEESITVSAEDLSQGQQDTLEKFGLDSAEITITPEMIQCAVERLGQTRVREIQNGATPTALEAIQLLACL